MYKYLAEQWKNPEKSGLAKIIRERAIGWRHGYTVTRVENPTRLNRARALGYKAKQGFIVVRVRIRRGGLRKIRPKAGRRQKKMGVAKYTTHDSLKHIAEGRVSKKFPNLKPLGTYWIWSDGNHKWYEVVLADFNHPSIKNSPRLKQICGKALIK
ncbi:MAG: 50S ribosomal protein L15e [Candidatus Bathyarchaeota archaeon]